MHYAKLLVIFRFSLIFVWSDFLLFSLCVTEIHLGSDYRTTMLNVPFAAAAAVPWALAALTTTYFWLLVRRRAKALLRAMMRLLGR